MTSIRLPSIFTVQWANLSDPNVQTAFRQEDKRSAETKFLAIARRRQGTALLAGADNLWDSCDRALSSASTLEALMKEPTARDIFKPADFSLLSKLGQGGYGCVYKAVHLETGHLVALKELTGNASAVEIKEHRTFPWDCGVIPCYGTFRATSNFDEVAPVEEDSDKITAVTTKETKALARDLSKLKTWLILKMCPNGSLLDRILQKGVLNEMEAARMIKTLVKTLLFLKENYDLVHNDIKPANLLQNDDGTYYLCDLGAAQRGRWLKERLGGTYSYMPVEKLRSRKLAGFLTHYCNHEKHDVWAMGITLFASFFCRHPFNAKDLGKCTTITSSGDDMANFYDLMEIDYGNIQYPDKCQLSEGAKEVLQGLLTVHCLDRLDLVAVKNNAWVKRMGRGPLHPSVFVGETLKTLLGACRSNKGNYDHTTEDQAFSKALWQPTATDDEEEQTTTNSHTVRNSAST